MFSLYQPDQEVPPAERTGHPECPETAMYEGSKKWDLAGNPLL
jgi:hypothetical protein